MPTGHTMMAMSLDGFVARNDHALDWLMKFDMAGEEHGFTEFMASVDVIVMGSDIQNYSTVPVRRVDLNVELHVDDDIEAGRQLMLAVMGGDERVLGEPAPAVFVTGMESGVVSLLGLCWVNNADWFATRDALIVDTARQLNTTEGVRPVIRELTVHNGTAGH